MKSRWFTRFAALAFAATAAGAWAQAPKGPVESRLEARKVVVAADGKETLAAATTAKPGDVIEYVATYRNTGREAVRNLEATLPIPANTELLPASITPAGARASLDGAAYAPMPLKRKTVRNGVSVEEAVPAAEVRSLRWLAPELGADKSVAFTARVKVLDDRATGPPGGTR